MTSPGLLDRPSGPVCEAVDDPGQEPGTGVRELLEQMTGRLVPADRAPKLGKDRPGVELVDQPEHGGAGLEVARHDRVLHGGGTAPARQQREVQVDPTQPWGAQQRLADEAPVGDDDAQVGPESDHVVAHGGEAIRADDGKAELLGGDRNRRRRQDALAAVGRILPGDHSDDVVRTCRECPQTRDRRVGTAGEDDPEALHPPILPDRHQASRRQPRRPPRPS